MAEEKDKPDPILEQFSVEDEDLKGGKQTEAELNIDAPEDKKTPERGEDGKFKGDEKKKPDEKEKKEPEAKKPAEEEKRKDETVPLAKYLDEKNKLRAELAQKDLTIKQVQDRLDAFEKKFAPKDETVEPDFIEDPKGYVDQKLAKALAAVEEANKKTADSGKEAQQTANEAAEAVQLQGFMRDLQAEETRFVAETPDYHDALIHLREIRAYQLQQFQPDITAEQIMAVIRQEETNLAIQLARAGRNPVTTAYELAKRHGYAPKAKPAPVIEQKKPTQLPPDQSLGGGGSATDMTDTDAQEPDAVDLALASVFRKRA